MTAPEVHGSQFPSNTAVVMGIVNVTPDSFSDGGRYLEAEAAIAHGLKLIEDGAQVIDVGGESTRPGAEPVDARTEAERVLPVIEALSEHARVSVDTTKPAVAVAAVEAGATIINDVSASLAEVAADTGACWIAMHMRGQPRTMQVDPRYGDVVGEVSAFLEDRAGRAAALGVREIWVDPGIGFGKTRAHNLSLLKHLPRLVELGWPVVVGTSRKSFLGELLSTSDGIAPVGDRIEGSVASATWAVACGARMIRAHDVEATAHAIKVVGPPVLSRASPA